MLIRAIARPAKGVTSSEPHTGCILRRSHCGPRQFGDRSMPRRESRSLWQRQRSPTPQYSSVQSVSRELQAFSRASPVGTGLLRVMRFPGSRNGQTQRKDRQAMKCPFAFLDWVLSAQSSTSDYGSISQRRPAGVDIRREWFEASEECELRTVMDNCRSLSP
jgi:hypothetical protein